MRLNRAGYSNALKLIESGKVNGESPWSWDAERENRILGDPPDWERYSRWHLGINEDANEETKARYSYPFGDGEKLYRSALRAIRTRSAQHGQDDIFEAAGRLLSKLDEGKEKNSANLSLNAYALSGPIMVLPIGEIIGRDGRRWVLTYDDASKIVDAIRRNGVDIVLDFEHGSYYGDGRAAGWFLADSFEVREDGIYAVLELTQSGKQAVESREYRYLSPSFYASGERILELESVALTNIPNIPVIPALNNKERGAEKMEVEMELNALRERLLETRKKLDDVIEERDKALLEISRLQGELSAYKLREREREINEMVERAIADGKLAPSQRETARRLGMNSRELLQELIDTSPFDFRLLRMEINEPERPAESKLDDVTRHVSRLLGVDTGILKIGGENGCR